jgi:hypothetical protein
MRGNSRKHAARVSQAKQAGAWGKWRRRAAGWGRGHGGGAQRRRVWRGGGGIVYKGRGVWWWGWDGSAQGSGGSSKGVVSKVSSRVSGS